MLRHAIVCYAEIKCMNRCMVLQP
uniref:Uncharacterized protein n=1 Tax=Arundo donax TaxID=35708 RepID=A0A0A8YCD2_ARUDO